jgi:hypothetical protein
VWLWLIIALLVLRTLFFLFRRSTDARSETLHERRQPPPAVSVVDNSETFVADRAQC